jgi:hypothetical protein
MPFSPIAQALKDSKESIILIYAFNATGKTRLSVAYKDSTKDVSTGDHAGVYYNAFSEDIFVWNNDTENDEEDMRLEVKPTSLNEFHSLLTEEALFKKLKPFKPRYDFKLSFDSNGEIIDIFFYEPKEAEDTARGTPAEEAEKRKSIKISRGEERIFVWCFFLALFEVEGWADKQNSHFFIDDPVSSLDDHNIFVTVSTLFDLIEEHHNKRKFIITTHHIGFFSILHDWLMKGEKADMFKKKTKPYVLSSKMGVPSLESTRSDVFLYHLHLLQTLEMAVDKNELFSFHFALLRQVLENIASFLGSGRINHVLEQIGITDANDTTQIMNALAHKKVYQYETERMNPNNEALFRSVFGKIKNKYDFKLHARPA